MEKHCSKCGNKLKDGKCSKCKEIKFSVNGKIDRRALKQAAKLKIKGKLIDIWGPFFIVMLITAVITGSATRFFEEGSLGLDMITSITDVLLLPISVGIIYFILNFIREKDYEIKNIFAFYKAETFINIFVATLIAGLLTGLGLILFLIPGIIIALMYQLTYYVIADNPQIKGIDAMKESKRLMDGYKSDYFLFSLSFIGWALLCVLIVPIIYVIPYISTANAMYYDEVKAIKNEN